MEVISMTARRIWKIFFAMVIIAALVLGGVAIYQAGFARGVVSDFKLPESSQYPLVPYGHMPYGRSIMPRLGLLGLFPLLCFGGFFFLMMFWGLSFFARRRAWMHDGPCANPHHWKYHGPPPWWGQGKPPEAGDQSQADSNTPLEESEDR
jgi:hypothetical protein